MKPIVAIVGRPNVGKSTLFNRIIGQRKSITLDVAGVTRDRHYGNASWDGKEFICVDTGGFPSDVKGSLEKKVQDQINLAIHEAEAILFVVDGQAGLLPEEKEIGDRLRKSGKKVIIVVSKIDQPSHEERLADFYSLSEKPMPVSGEHGYGVAELLEEVVNGFPSTLSEEAIPEKISIAILGRPNVGKSSLLNCLLGEERVVVDETPGTTRDVIDTPISRDGQDYLLLDTAGIRRHGKSASKVERFSVLRALSAIERSKICLAVFDAKEGIQKQDAHVVGYAFEEKKGVVLIWNKCDLLPNKKGVRDSLKKMARERLKFLAHAPLAFISAKTGEGTEVIWSMVDRLHLSMGKKVKTSDLNALLEKLVLTHNLPVYKGKPVKFYYMTQTGTFPPQFVVFTNEPEGVHFSFQRFLVNQIREEFRFDGAPIQLVFKRKS
ncbi:MAG: ribosome biogenesis GTPase Der [Deltaproteobacteria bacterium]|nr:ribosome biogenesis GTPase Der [Deltaproteobacteria bacterium]